MLCLKGTNSLAEAEKQFMIQADHWLCDLVSTQLESLDDEMFKASDDQCLRKDQRNLQCVFGNVRFFRRLVNTADGSHVYPLDAAMGLLPMRRYSPHLSQLIAQIASTSTMRATANAVSTLTMASISFQAVDNVVRQVGQDIRDVRQAETNNEDCWPDIKPKALPELFVEADAYEVKQKGGKGKRLLVHRFQVYEGVMVNGKRHILINRHVNSNLSRHVALKEMEVYLLQHYDMKHATVFSGSDNGSGYEPEVFTDLTAGAAQHVHVLDRFHLNQKIKQRLSFAPDAQQLQDPLRKALYRNDWERVDELLTTADSIATGGQPEDAKANHSEVQALQAYLYRNKASIEPLANPQWTKQVRSLGCCESNHRRYTYRTKKQGRSWSPDGLAAMLRIIDCEQNRNLEATLKETEMLGLTIAPELKAAAGKVSRQFIKPDHEGAVHGTIFNDGPTSSPLGRFAQSLSDSSILF
ncbi:ISLre2 family transposase [Lacticaseibacillus paracasei]|uniref:ISLre2 family transposase n=1 Tax=Lacticaseibacillus paracasei TaxID=1597 RepID=UPI003DA8B65F